MFTMASFGLRLWGGIAAIVCGALRASEAALRWTEGVAVSRWAVVVSVLLFVLASGAATAGVDAWSPLAGLESFCGKSLGVTSPALAMDSSGWRAVTAVSADVALTIGRAPN
jgi:hypothetical protein